MAAVSQHATTDVAERTLVVVVDDESNITDLVATVLRYEGFDVQTASTGRDALKAVSAFRPSLVVLDIMLPDLDGFEVQRQLADNGGKIPDGFPAAQHGNQKKVRCLSIGARAYVHNAFTLQEL